MKQSPLLVLELRSASRGSPGVSLIALFIRLMVPLKTVHCQLPRLLREYEILTNGSLLVVEEASVPFDTSVSECLVRGLLSVSVSHPFLCGAGSQIQTR